MVKYQETQLDAVFAALADSTRREVLRSLSGGSLPVSELAAPHEMSLPGFMKHLRVLEDAGLIARNKEGRVVSSGAGSRSWWICEAGPRTGSQRTWTSKSPGETTMPKVKPIPEGMHSVTPHLVCAGAADAIEFYKKAFGAIEMARLPGPDGKLMHAMIRIGDSAVMLVDENPEWGMLGPKALKGSSVAIHLYVEDADAFAARAVKAGAKITMPLDDMFWGDR